MARGLGVIVTAAASSGSPGVTPVCTARNRGCVSGQPRGGGDGAVTLQAALIFVVVLLISPLPFIFFSFCKMCLQGGVCRVSPKPCRGSLGPANTPQVMQQLGDGVCTCACVHVCMQGEGTRPPMRL